MIELARLEMILESIPRLSIGLLGDLFLDRYLEIDAAASELSIETGLEAYQVTRVRNSPGALGTVMNNLASLGVGSLVPVTVIGQDGHGFDLLAALRTLPVDDTHIVSTADRFTPTYTKPLLGQPDSASTWRELNRLDVRTRGPLDPLTCQRVVDHLCSVFDTTDGLIVLDQIVEQGWGVVNSRVRTVLEELSRQDPDKVLYVDSRKHLGQFPFGILKANQAELGEAMSCDLTDETSLHAAVKTMSQRTQRPVFCTLGPSGILVADGDAEPRLVPGYPVEGPVDIVGAGDAATSGIVVSLLSGATPVEAAAVGNLVASITVRQLGTTGTATPAQVIQRWKESAVASS